MSRARQFWMVKGVGPATVVHSSRDIAERDARRLAMENPDVEFYVMEAVAVYRRVSVERIAFDGTDDLIPF